jgi:DNA gyrase subunit A
MVVAEPTATLLTACARGYGKRTPFGAALAGDDEPEDTNHEEDLSRTPGDDDTSSSQRYRVQRRGGKGLRDIKATARNGPVIGIARVGDDDELLMMTARGKIQRVQAAEISVIGRNTQGVRIMTLDDSDTLAAVVRVPREENGVEHGADGPSVTTPGSTPGPPGSAPDPPSGNA